MAVRPFHPRTVFLLFFVAVALATALPGWQPAPAQGQPAGVAASSQKLPQPVVNTHELMELFNKPYFMMLKQEMQQAPSGREDEKWKSIADRGLQAAELTNLIAIRELQDEHRQVFEQRNSALREAGMNLAAKAKSKDWEQTQAAYRTLVQNCNACHQALAADHAPHLQP